MIDHSGRCTSAQSPWLRESVGAYALGALDPAEADLVAAHLAGCAGCREEYLELGELVPLLALVSETEAVDGPVRPEPPALDQPSAREPGGAGEGAPATAPGDRCARSRRRAPRPAAARLSRGRRAQVVAVAVVLAAGCVLGARLAGFTPRTGTAWSASARPGAPRTDPDADDVSASILVVSAPWGSAIRMRIQHVPSGYECTMIVVAADGRREAAATWNAPSPGAFAVPASSSISPDQISSIQVRLPDGTVLVAFRHP